MRDETLRINARQGSTTDVLLLELTGPLLCHNVFDFQQTVRATGARVLIVDMAQVPYVDSTGIGALVGAHVSFDKGDKRLCLVGVNDRIKGLFEMTQVDRFFRRFDSVQDAELATATQVTSRTAARGDS